MPLHHGGRQRQGRAGGQALLGQEDQGPAQRQPRLFLLLLLLVAAAAIQQGGGQDEGRVVLPPHAHLHAAVAHGPGHLPQGRVDRQEEAEARVRLEDARVARCRSLVAGGRARLAEEKHAVGLEERVEAVEDGGGAEVGVGEEEPVAALQRPHKGPVHPLEPPFPRRGLPLRLARRLRLQLLHRGLQRAEELLLLFMLLRVFLLLVLQQGHGPFQRRQPPAQRRHRRRAVIPTVR